MAVSRVLQIRRLAALALACAAVGVAACVKDGGTTPKSGAVGVRAINVSPDAGPVTVMIDHTVAVAQAPFLIDTLLSVPSGAHTVAFDSAGTTMAIWSAALEFGLGTSYDLILAGTATGASPTAQLLGGTNPPAGTIDLSTLAAVRLFNAVADTGHLFGDSINVYFTDSTDQLANTKLRYAGMHPYTSAALNGNGAPVYFSVEPGTYHVIVTSPIDTTQVAADSLVVLTAGEVRTIIAAPSQNQASGNLVIVRDAN